MKNPFLLIVLSLAVVVSVNAQRTSVKIGALPEPIPNFLNTNYPGFVIDKADRIVTNNNEVSYEIVITKGAIKETLAFDKSGTFLRKQVGSKPIQAKSNVNKVAPEVKKNNITKKPALRITKVANEDKKEEPIQKLTPDTIKQKN